MLLFVWSDLEIVLGLLYSVYFFEADKRFIPSKQHYFIFRNVNKIWAKF